jgi:hypothetical protein
MEYRVLGPVEVLAEGRPVAIGGPKPRSLLVLLLLNAGRVVATSQVIEALWGGRPPGATWTRPPPMSRQKPLPETCQKLRYAQSHAAPRPNPRQRLSAARLRGYVRCCAAL